MTIPVGPEGMYLMSAKLIPATKVVELREVASARTICRWLEAGSLSGRKLGRRWFTSREAVVAFLQGGRAK